MTLPTRRVFITRGQKFIKTAGLLIPVVLFGAGQNTYAGDAAFNQAMPFNIPAQSLSSALTRFSADTRLQVLYEGDVADKLQAPALNGTYTPAEALEKLLGGTGLKSRYTNDKTITIEAPSSQNQPNTPTLKAMTVTGKSKYDATDPYDKHYAAPNSSFATKTDTPIMETPLNIQVLPKAVLDDQQAIKMDQALKYVSGVTTGQAAGGLTDQPTIRGFFNYNLFRNGFRIDASGPEGTRNMANVQSIEVLKGPAAMLYGRVEPGGMVNIVTKKPLESDYYSVQQQFGSFDLYRTSIDATGPIVGNKNLLYRMNVAYENSGSFRENVDYDKVFVAPVLQWNISPQTTALLELEYRKESNVYDLHARPLITDGTRADGTWINPRLADIPRERNLMEDNRNHVEDKLIGLNLSHKFNDNWTLTEQLNIQLLDRDRIMVWTPPLPSGIAMCQSGRK
ncbi:MAG: TonB-dependent receptor [Methylobacter sp.]|nr:TonB-dependent receptor [Methylobacter sp.]